MSDTVTPIRSFDNFAEEVRQHLVPIDSVRPWPDNPRRGDIAALTDSIKTNGFYTVIAVQESSGQIVAGNHRWQVLRNLGATEVPAVLLKITDEDALRIVLGDNRSSDLAFYDDPTLFELLKKLDGDFRGTGYDKASYELLLQAMEANEILGGIAQGFVPEDRLQGYLDSDIRNIILPYQGEDFDMVATKLRFLRESWGLDTNADVVERLVYEAAEEVETLR